ncbi:pre-mRNA-processing-splicing factor 8-like protein [Perkinsela sp. CCAP 1560/4]|nr:pre-mRNA-processing-splicing factor 8-like protein [Perkinsela sp. CCAP 1560/4]|eukprot:KNH06334.1 pre-mRNA-processing-splicing factor 8-like protein [Perkinsela sp. CCAP 1560/4]
MTQVTCPGASKGDTSHGLPPEYLRKAFLERHEKVRETGSTKDKTRSVLAMRYLPRAILKLWETIPMPWEPDRIVRVTFHVDGFITLVADVPHVIESAYVALWGVMWMKMRKEKSLRMHFLRLKMNPIFDDDEPPVQYTDALIDNGMHQAIELSAEMEEAEVLQKFAHTMRFFTGKRQTPLTRSEQAILCRLGRVLLSDSIDSNSRYLFDEKAFVAAKNQDLVIPGGPKYRQVSKEVEDDWTEFNDCQKTIYRHPVKPQYRVAFPHLYNSSAEYSPSAPFHEAASGYLRSSDPELPTFTFDPLIHPIPACPMGEADTPSEEGSPFTPFFENIPMSDAGTSEGLEILWSRPFFQEKAPKPKSAIDLPLVDEWYFEKCPTAYPVKVRVSYQRLMKHSVGNFLKKKKESERSRRRKRASKQDFGGLGGNSKYFKSTKLDWLEAALQLCTQAHDMLSLYLKRRNLDFIHLDYNFNLKPKKALTTKERKRSRLGPAFHLLRELLKVTKMLVDCHVKHRLGEIDAYQLADAVHYIFTHVGKLSGIYRYKYTFMRSIKHSKDIKHLLYYRFNTGPVGKGPGMGFWAPVWRMWVCLFRGMVPLLEKFITRLVEREIEGRNQKSVVKKITKQRSESTYDREMRLAIIREVHDIIPESMRAKKIQLILQHFSEAWRRWKSNAPCEVHGLPAGIQALIMRFVKQKADWWTSAAYFNRKRVANGQAIDKATVRKNHGRLVRIQLKAEHERQKNWVENGPFLKMEDFTSLYTAFAKWLSTQDFQQIPFPPVAYKHDMKILRLALDKLRENHGAPGSRTTSAAKHEQLKIEEAFNNPQTTINKIKRKLLQMRTFKCVSIEYVDYFTRMFPVYDVDVDEKIVDAYLYQYISFEAHRRGLFPAWVKPSDDLPNPARLYNWCNDLNSIPDVWRTAQGERTVYVEAKLENLSENIESALLNQILRLVVDKNLADYMMARNNSDIAYKDMRFTNNFGLIKGFLFAPFVYQVWALMIDLVILGLARASELAAEENTSGPAASGKSAHPIRMYMRYLDQIHIVYRLSRQQANELMERTGHFHGAVRSVIPEFSVKTCWPKHMRMRFSNEDTRVANAVVHFVRGRLPQALTSLTKQNSFVSVYSQKNPLLLFGMNGFELCIKPRCRTKDGFELSDDQNVWHLMNKHSHTVTAQAFLCVSPVEITNFQIKIRLVLLNSGQTPFKKLVEKWNTQLSSLIVYFREAIYGSPALLQFIKKGANKIQNRIKVQLNSKMPKRFPPVVFYTPVDLWGLGMLSIGHSLVVEGSGGGENATHFRGGLNQTADIEIPNVMRYVTPWQDEIRESARVWSEYKAKSEEAVRSNRRIVIEDIHEMRGLGIPRIATIFQADRQTLYYDIGWRVAQEFKVHNVQRPQPFWFTNTRHDGKLFSFEKYKADVVQAFGGIEAILSHSIFPATGYVSWDGLDWNRISKFEETMQARKITNAQRGGLSKIPNQRFALWWSPTINRSSVYVGFLTQLDFTGVFLHAKLPLLKMSLAQIFQNHMWPKIHEGIVVDVCKSLEANAKQLRLEEVEQCIVSHRKSVRMNCGSADILIRADEAFPVTIPSGMDEQESPDVITTSDTFWVDVQLRWGDYDANDIDKYVRSLFLSYTTDRGESKYPSPTGVVIAFDLAYNSSAAFGFWFPGLKDFLRRALLKVKQNNTELYRFRSTLNSKLQLAPVERAEPPLSAQNFDDLFSRKTVWLLEGSCIKLSTAQRTVAGFNTTKPLNGAVFVISPSTGKLYLLIVHADTWKGQKRLSSLVKTKVAESCAVLIRSLPKEDHPKLIVTMQRQVLEPVNAALSGLTNTVIKGSNLLIPLRSLAKVPRLYQLMQKATASETHLVHLYDDWLEQTSHVTAFFRLIIILRAMNINEARAKKILQLDNEELIASQHLWPSLAPEAWLDTETRLKDLIIADYCKRNGVDVSRITPTEVRDVLFGQEIGNVEAVQQRAESIQSAQQSLEKYSEALSGEGAINQPAEPPLPDTKVRPWREDFATAHIRAGLPLPRVHAEVPRDGENSFSMPDNLCRQFVQAANLPTRTVALLYARAHERHRLTIRCAVFPPQAASASDVRFPLRLPSHTVLGALQPVGLLLTAADNYHKVPQSDERIALSFMEANRQIFPSGRPLLLVRMFEQGDRWALAAFLMTIDGPIGESPIKYSYAPFSTTAGMNCFFCIPEDGIWNKTFDGTPIPANASYPVKIGTPRPYFDPSQRSNHFKSR